MLSATGCEAALIRRPLLFFIDFIILIGYNIHVEDSKLNKRRQYKRNWYKANRNSVLEKERIYYQKNKQRINKRRSDKLKNDIQTRLAKRLRDRLRVSIKNNQKSGSAIQDLGCSIYELMLYIASKFEPGMNWENYGEWHIDHIIPLSRVDLTNRTELLKVVHYTNLQPLWPTDNFKKSNKI